jgi:hypothetical protein
MNKEATTNINKEKLATDFLAKLEKERMTMQQQQTKRPGSNGSDKCINLPEQIAQHQQKCSNYQHQQREIGNRINFIII